MWISYVTKTNQVYEEIKFRFIDDLNICSKVYFYDQWMWLLIKILYHNLYKA